MTQTSYNCIICAGEFDSEELHSIALSDINVTNFKVCQACLDSSNPEEDYREVRQIVDSYLKFTEAKSLFGEAQDLIKKAQSR
jgi:hypothetical protein